MCFFAQCVLVFILAFLIDVIAALHLRAFIEHSVTLAVVTVIGVHYLGYFQHAWFIDYPRTSQRLAITTASAFGAGAGSAVVICYM